MKTWHEQEYEVWALRHAACKKCHAGCDGVSKEEAGPCICGPEPCKRCGNTWASMTGTGCETCDRQNGDGKFAKSIDIESSWYVIYVNCPYCGLTQGVEGHDRGHHPLADALECGDSACGKKAWLGLDKHGDYDDIDDDEVGVEVGQPRVESKS